MWRSRWAAIGAAIAVSAGAGGVGLVSAVDSGDRPVTITVAPERVLDTREDLGLAGRFVTDTPRRLQITGDVPVASGGTKTVVPADAVAVIVNVTVVAPDGPGFLTLRPDGTERPTTSTVNFLPGAIEPNAATVDLAPDGTIQVWFFASVPGGTGDVLVDIVGYTVDHTHDDRYYTETEVDALVAAIPQGPAGPTGPVGPEGPAGPAGPAGAAGSYEHVIVVAEDGGDFTSVVDAMAAIGTDADYPAASPTERYLVWVAPGSYDGQVVMQEHVDIEGAGQGVTTLRATAGAGAISPSAATLVGAANAELRKIRVEVTPPDPSNWSHAIYTDQATTFREVTASSTGGARSRGMVVATGGAPILIDVVLLASGASDSNLGLDLFGATAFGDGVFASVSGGVAAKAVLVNNASSEVSLENITTIASGGSAQTYGIEALNSSLSLEGYRTTTTGTAGDVLGARCGGSERFLKILDGTVFASNSGGQARGVFGSDCDLELRDMVIDAVSEGTANAQGIDHFQNSAGTTSNISIADVEIRAESTEGSSYGIQMNGNAGGLGSYGEVRDATIRSISGGPTRLNYGIRHAAQGEIRYRTSAITVGGVANWAYGVQATGGVPRFDDVVVDAVLEAETTVFGAEIFTPGTVMTNVRARAINLDSGSSHDAVGLKVNSASDVVIRDASAYAEAETNAFGVDLTGGSARVLRLDANAVGTGAGARGFGVRCVNGTDVIEISDATSHASGDFAAWGAVVFDCDVTVADSVLVGKGGFSYGFLSEVTTGSRFATVFGSHLDGGTGSVGSGAAAGLTVDVKVVESSLAGGSGVTYGAGTILQECTAVTFDVDTAPTFDAGTTSPCP